MFQSAETLLVNLLGLHCGGFFWMYQAVRGEYCAVLSQSQSEDELNEHSL